MFCRRFAVCMECPSCGEIKRLFNIVENFILFDASRPGSTRKVVGCNHQVLVVNLGVFWQTQGSGKSYSMAFFTEKVGRKVPGNFTFVIEIVISEAQGEVAEFKKWGVDIIPHRERVKKELWLRSGAGQVELDQLHLDDPLALHDLKLPATAGLLRELFQRVDVVEIDLLDLAHFRVDVAGHGDVDKEQGPVFSRPAGFFHVRPLHDRMRRAGRGNDYIHSFEHTLPIVETHGAAAHFCCQFLCPVEGAIRDEDRLGPTRDQTLRGDPAHFASSQDHHLAVLQVPENFLCQVHRHVSNRRCAFLDRCFRPHLLADSKRSLENFV